MEHSYEGTEIDAHTSRLGIEHFAIDVVIRIYPSLCGLVAQLSRQFRQFNISQGWFAELLRQFVVTQRIYVEDCWKTIRLMYAAVKQVEWGILNAISYQEFIKKMQDFIRVYGLEYFVRDENFRPKPVNKFTKQNRIFRLLALPDEEFRSTYNYFIDRNIVKCAYKCGIVEAELVRFRCNMELCDRSEMFYPYDAIAFGCSTELVDSLVVPNCHFGYGAAGGLTLRGTLNLEHWLDKFPSLFPHIVTKKTIKTLVKGRKFKLFQRLLDGLFDATIHHFLQYGLEFDYSTMLTCEELQQFLPYRILEQSKSSWLLGPFILVLGQNYFEAFTGLDKFISNDSERRACLFVDFYNRDVELATRKALSCKIVLEKIVEFYTGESTIIEPIVELLNK